MSDSLSASEYILDNFKPSDRIAVLLRNRNTEEVIQRIASVKDVAARDFQEWLKERNQAGFDIYIGMNTLKEGARSRTKRDIHEIRHVYLDLDYRGSEALKAIQNSDEVPKPNFVLDTSPGKHQVVWKLEGATPQEAEDLQQRMAHEFGADVAATDASRVLRLPGFANRKYGNGCAVRVTKHSDRTYNLRDFQIASGPAKGERTPEQGPPRLGGERETLTQSERDWAYARRALARGDDPEEIIRRIADYRADEKHDPEYYARHTVAKAQADMQNRAATQSSEAAEISHNSREMP
ncbi:MAG TPA: DNA-primase RepB domain-containing protein [Candidatus Acidoferrales bacterium]|nr:DNA-primase RepB domain-containing protein [Candidatus Acidoferrales bacterium]